MSDLEKKLNELASLNTPEPSSDSKNRAQKFAMAAFDEVQENKKPNATQGKADLARPNFITNMMKGLFAMENRYVLTAAMTGMLILPLGFLLYSNTALTPIGQSTPRLDLPLIVEETRAPALESQDFNEMAVSEAEAMSDGGEQAQKINQIVTQSPAPTPMISPPNTPDQSVVRERMAPVAEADFAAGSAANDTNLGGMVQASPQAEIAIAPERPLNHLDDDRSGDQFEMFENAQVKSTSDAPVSTFSIDVDTASYTYARRALLDGWLPAPDAVRVEEMVNYFDYDYAVPTDPGSPFATHISVAPSPWDVGKQIMRIGVQGYEIAAADRPPANLVFLIDTSGSMNDADKLPLLVKSFSMMLDALNAEDRVSIVTYAGSAGVALEPTPANEKRAILQALRSLAAGGSTAGAQGIELAYQLAQDAFVEGGSNQVILATDGDFNVGLSDPQALSDYIEAKRDAGVFLSVLGFGTGNLNDQVMQSLAQNGNGTAHYIDSLREARSVLVYDITATLVPIAKDVKIQVEFNPAQISEYRLLGYETRALNREDFNNDRVDAGEVGAGAAVTAIYELTPVGSPATLVEPLRYDAQISDDLTPVSDELGYFKLRYKLPEEDESQLIEVPIDGSLLLADLAQADEDLRFSVAVATFAQKLRGNPFVAHVSYDEIRNLAQGAKGTDVQGKRAEFVGLVDLAAALSQSR